MGPSVVITGSTRGIGFGLAGEFLGRRCRVLVSGRSNEAVEGAVESLSATHDAGLVAGAPCDVTDFEQVQSLWDSASQAFGTVDIWINNAGIGTPTTLLWDQPPERIEAVVSTNLTGLMFGCHVAVRGMLDQGAGKLFNMEGFGSTDMMRPGMTVYGTTKRAVRYLTRSLQKETKGTPIVVGSIAPGMVITDMLLDNVDDGLEGSDRALEVFNILGDRIETVAPFIVDGILGADKSGTHISWLSRRRIVWRFATSRFHDRGVLDTG